MLFNSVEFLFFFLPLTCLAYYLAVAMGKPLWCQGSLLLASLFFYAFWEIRFLPLLLLSITFNYVIGQRILCSQSGTSRFWLACGIVCNLLVLFGFKYLMFLLSTMQHIFGLSVPIPTIVLPLGISFFTFTQIAFLVDAYKRQVDKLTPQSYGLFVTIFPHLIAGPILHHRDMMGQFNDTSIYRWNVENIAKGLFLFTIGMAKKVLIADSLVPIVAAVFDDRLLMPTFLDAWGAAIGYALQLYFDFSGYSDMAIGLGLLFNVHLPINFNSPYKATSIIDFWRRWHMTLSTFLRDYLYIPLGGSRSGHTSKLLNLFLTMLLGGLWHGAGWTFVLWGALQGTYLVVNHLIRERWHVPTALAWPMTLLAVIVGWVLFRSSDLMQAQRVMEGMVGLNGLILPEKFALWISHASWGGDTIVMHRDWRWIGLLASAVLLLPNSQELSQRFRPGRLAGAVAGVVLACCILNFHRVSEFLYFQF